MGETSRAKVTPSRVLDLETPTFGVDVQLRQINKSSDKQRTENCTSGENDPGVTTPTRVLFADKVSSETQKSDAPVVTSEAAAGEVGRALILFFFNLIT